MRQEFFKINTNFYHKILEWAKNNIDINRAYLIFPELIFLSLSKDLSARIRSIADLPDNWDGYGASAIPNIIIRNTCSFLKVLQKKGIKIKDTTDIYPTPYGTVVIEVNNDKGLISMEIGKHCIGFFTDYRHTGNWGSEGIDTDFKDIPEQLKQHLL